MAGRAQEGLRDELGAVRVQTGVSAQRGRRFRRRRRWMQREAVGCVGHCRQVGHLPVGEEWRGRVGEAGRGKGTCTATWLLHLIEAAVKEAVGAVWGQPFRIPAGIIYGVVTA